MGPIILPVLPMPGTQVEAGKGRPIEGHSGDNGDQPDRVPIDRSSRPANGAVGTGVQMTPLPVVEYIRLCVVKRRSFGLPRRPSWLEV